MKKKMLRIYQTVDFEDVRQHTLLYGDLAGSCSHCNALNVPLSASICPECRMEFRYIAFRSVQHHRPKMSKLISENPRVLLIDFDDYKRTLAEVKAQEFWD